MIYIKMIVLMIIAILMFPLVAINILLTLLLNGFVNMTEEVMEEFRERNSINN